MNQAHCFPTLEELTRGAIAACGDCNCIVCKANAETLRRVLVYPGTRRKHAAAIAGKALVELHAVANAKSPGYHKQVVDLVVATTMAWTHSLDRFDDTGRDLAVEYFRDAWRQLTTNCQCSDAFEDLFRTPDE